MYVCVCNTSRHALKFYVYMYVFCIQTLLNSAHSFSGLTGNRPIGWSNRRAPPAGFSYLRSGMGERDCIYVQTQLMI